ncbi:hypothetical protein Micbo1qcDRAFT_226601 [Microdochium bolleyi]|uniref:Zn(2)-C6 fungal-type domain-containing protein n=1 Tax=Microdochium bolleyi TaxID=196109 RepID=A0A136J0A2_9PEZI|nr:hypothetical protein Micbo1qcDRAFT_226601 [Microdochium bolleyi]
MTSLAALLVPFLQPSAAYLAEDCCISLGVADRPAQMWPRASNALHRSRPATTPAAEHLCDATNSGRASGPRQSGACVQAWASEGAVQDRVGNLPGRGMVLRHRAPSTAQPHHGRRTTRWGRQASFNLLSVQGHLSRAPTRNSHPCDPHAWSPGNPGFTTESHRQQRCSPARPPPAGTRPSALFCSSARRAPRPPPVAAPTLPRRRHAALLMSVPPKRKRSSDVGAGSPEHDPARTEPLRLESVDKYPRKRVMTACNLCRFRKTKCDAVRPSCSFCTDLGVECHYRDTGTPQAEKPEPPQKLRDHHSVKDTIKTLEARLRTLEEDVRELRAEKRTADRPPPDAVHVTGQGHTPGSFPVLSPGKPTPSAPSMHDALSPVLLYRDAMSNAAESPRDDILFRRSRPEVYTARPSLLTFCCPPYIDARSWDDYSDFYADEIRAGEEFLTMFDVYLSSEPDLGRRTIRRLQQSFVDHYLGWIPIIEPDNVGSVVDMACSSGTMTRDVNGCLAMFILAVGAITQDTPDSDTDELAGIEYFTQGCQMLERFSLLIESLEMIHCRILQAAYFKLALRPIQAWNAITAAGRDCRHVLSSTTSQLLPPTLKESWNRAFWACSLIIDELEQSLRMHPEGHRAFHDIIPLPTFTDENVGFYYFLAMISLRKMLQDVLDVVGYRQGTVVYAPVVTAELRRQTQEWYDRLPPAVRFPLDDAPLFDPRKNFLRGQYFCMFVVLEWASVLRVMEAHSRGEGAGPARRIDEKLAMARTEAQDCIRNTVIYLRCAEEQLARWKMPVYNVIWTSFAFVAKLIICYRSPALAFVPETAEADHITNALSMLQPWKHIPFVRRGLERMSAMFEQVNAPGNIISR